MISQKVTDKPEPERLKFVHRFGSGVLCELEVNAQPPDGDAHFNFAWSGRPKPKHIPEYKRWALAVLEIISARWDRSIMYCVGISPRETELWHFEPGHAPKRVNALPFGMS